MMKKRDFLKAGAIAAVAAPVLANAGGGSERLYGTPGSVDPAKSRDSTLRLSIARSELPVETWDSVENYANAVRAVLEDPKARAAFVDSPEVYFSRAGFKLGVDALQSRDVAMLKIALDPHIQERAASGDYAPIFEAMERHGVLDAEPGVLTKKIIGVIEANRPAFASLLAGAHSGDEAAERVVQSLTGAGQRRLLENSRPNTPGYVYAYTKIAISTEAVVASEAIGGLYIAVAAAAIAVVVVVVDRQSTTGPQHHGLNLPSGVGKLDEGLMRDYSRSTQMAKLLGAPGMGAEALRRLVHQELDAIVDAMAASGVYDPQALRAEHVREQVLAKVDGLLGFA